MLVCGNLSDVLVCGNCVMCLCVVTVACGNCGPCDCVVTVDHVTVPYRACCVSPPTGV